MPRTARDVVFVDGVRTPFGKAGPNGLYAETRADDMVVSVIRELLRRNPALPPERVGEVAIAATTQTGDQVLAFLDHFKIADDDPRVNPWGGAIALGHPLASSGVRLMIQLARQFAGQPGVRYGLTTMCVGMGMGGTVLWENLNA